MDTEHASPTFKVGDRVRAADDHRCTGTVIQRQYQGFWLYEVLVSAGESEWFLEDELASPGPLGVEPWRLLFRAHRDGWELLTEHRPDELGPERCRWWHNASTGQVFAFTTVEAR